jgi:transposase InsO family protein
MAGLFDSTVGSCLAFLCHPSARFHLLAARLFPVEAPLMPAATPPPTRQRILDLQQQGLGPPQIARLLSMPASTIRGLLRQWRQQPPGSGLEPHFQRCGRSLRPERLAVQQSCCAVRRQHPRWGAGRIRIALLDEYPKELVPPTRTLQLWLQQAGLAPTRLRHLVKKACQRAQEAHDVWQMDAVEHLLLLDQSAACWLRMTDEYSGAILATALFPVCYWSTVPLHAVQEALRCAFERWGQPRTLRVDNGNPWGTTSGLPSCLSLWAAGLGIDMHWNDPYCPQQNGVVESTQGTTQRWAEPGQCANFAQLCRRVAEEDRVQREVYPAIDGQSRVVAYPFLSHSGRGYSRTWEKYGWDLPAALALLANYRVRRKVVRRGQIWLYNRQIQVGEAYAGSEVDVQLDAASVQWVITDLQGQEIRRRPAVGLTEESLRTLSFAKHQTKRSEQRAARRAAKRVAGGCQQPAQGGQGQ